MTPSSGAMTPSVGDPHPSRWPLIWAAAVAAMGVGSTPERGSCLCREIKAAVSIHKHSCILHEEDIVKEESQIKKKERKKKN